MSYENARKIFNDLLDRQLVKEADENLILDALMEIDLEEDGK